MNNESGKKAQDTAQAPLAPEAAARRRMLLKSLGKGSAVVVAAASPLTSFAAPMLVPTTEGTQCTFSGFNSVVASKGPVAPLPCGGFRASHFVDVGPPATPVGWPNFVFPMRSGATSPANLKFSDLFGSSAPTTKVLDILATNSPSDLALFVAAYFNALLVMQSGAAPSGRSGLPYSTSDVVSQYASGAYHASVPQFYRLVLVAS